jgi:molybdopterin-guanine dinucleotide biosynthesis protein A
MPPRPPSCAVILAGGAGRRMGGVQKGLVGFAGRPLVAQVIDGLAPQVDHLALSVNGDPAGWLGFGLPLIADAFAGFPGPLAGMAAGLAYAATLAPAPEAVVFVPTDAPFLPGDLVARLLAARAAGGADAIAVAHGPAGPEPVVAALPVSLAAELAAHVAAHPDGAGVRDFYARHAAIAVPFAPPPGRPDPFTNVNTPGELAAAEALLADAAAAALPSKV